MGMEFGNVLGHGPRGHGPVGWVEWDHGLVGEHRRWLVRCRGLVVRDWVRVLGRLLLGLPEGLVLVGAGGNVDGHILVEEEYDC